MDFETFKYIYESKDNLVYISEEELEDLKLYNLESTYRYKSFTFKFFKSDRSENYFSILKHTNLKEEKVLYDSDLNSLINDVINTIIVLEDSLEKNLSYIKTDSGYWKVKRK